ncbi:hypothetical protein [Mycobacterium sp.]|uniref:phage holin n=1 Tax=Mycobacterium sp. TaxID=1785 RepID=UPI0025D3D8B3|nr:hypothetical protein [Mycobacterium sp.]
MLDKLRARISRYLPETRREKLHVLLVAFVGYLLAGGVLTNNQAELWTRLGAATISLLFAWLYARDAWRAALYGVVVTLGGVLYAYGVAQGINWAIIVATTAQALGMGTAAAKTVPGKPDYVHFASGIRYTGGAGGGGGGGAGLPRKFVPPPGA